MDPSRVYRVPADNLPRLKTRIDSLVARAEKLGVPPVRLIEEGTEQQGQIVYHRVRLEGQAPVVEGWTLIAELEHSKDPEVGTVIHSVTADRVPDLYLTRGAECDHCGFKRPRKQTYLLRHLDGRLMQVGTACLKDFVGGRNPEAMAAYAELLFSAGEELEQHAHAPAEEISRDRFLYWVAALSRVRGYVSRKEAREKGLRATADEALSAARGKVVPVSIGITADDREQVRQALEWVRELRRKEGLDDYIWNLVVATRSPRMEPRWAGVVASLLEAKKRSRSAFHRAQPALSRYWGEPGQEVELEATLKKHSTFQRDGRQNHVYKFTDQHRRWAVLFTEIPLAMEEGRTYRVRATIRRGQERDGFHETLLDRLVETPVARTRVTG